MFKRSDITLISNPVCLIPIDNLNEQDFVYYDKDGFELCIAEQKFYRAMNYPIDSLILNHRCWQEPWFELDTKNQKLILDHCMFLCRSSYGGDSLRQLQDLKKTIPQADLLIKTKIKWGFDFALDAVADDGSIYEVLHVEYDNYDYQSFINHMIVFEHHVKHTDWLDAAERIWNLREKWQHLRGFDQNHWKANYLIGWSKAEYTEKAI